ncbi:protein-L-isoaspartate(D-aspartate) O-methyltransferase [Hydrogenophaga sp.]|uniref:protein-L-isoaspartate(D-aspartate) O-methyltransferase n=1 Tax=Hydrogenophaga sp. TaxID=1904254 RepID=UPI0019A9376D|nr:protein-L-isoaspartate(D-aspartate) O-methyltransferase [Hydrogenophaga sp.]MBD3892762.1 protein-L-isoaspartate(D-aspartate) O-methyltransferase [Hydrogenophaga sp.]
MKRGIAPPASSSEPTRARPTFPVRLAPMSSNASVKQPASAPALRSAPVVAVGADEGRAARMAMVDKLQAQGLSDAALIAALQSVPRHRFVDSALANQAYEDTSLPLGLGQTISKPNVVARMLALLCQGGNRPLGRVLEVGTGCGYQAALLSHLAQEVYSIERLRALHERARHNLRALRRPNLHLLLGDGLLGYAAGAPYAAIIVAAGGPELAPAWIDQLAPGGRLVAPLEGQAQRQRLVVIDKTASGVRRTELEAVLFVPIKSGVE